MFIWFCVLVGALTGRFVTEQSPIVGGPQKVPVNDNNVLDAAQFAVVEFNKANTEDMFDYKIVNVTSAELQVVAGLNYFLKMHLGRTTWKKDNTAANEPLDFHSQPKKLECNFTVYEIPWKYSRVLFQEECKAFVNL
ncbi:cystatin-like [Sander lucioperca]|uniref:cystatin-like n=1 Tax=Sander lucioperca TaxID=283035 RepID=UPI00125E2D42|nr:cystatin-like [Sander lucioperca]